LPSAQRYLKSQNPTTDEYVVGVPLRWPSDPARHRLDVLEAQDVIIGTPLSVAETEIIPIASVVTLCLVFRLSQGPLN